MHEAKAAERVGEVLAGGPGELPADPAIHKPAHERHVCGVGHPVANDELCLRRAGVSKEARDILRGMLAVAVERHRPGKSGLTCGAPAELERHPLALWAVVTKDARAGLVRQPRGTVARAIVDDECGWQKPPTFLDEGRDGPGLVEARDDDGTSGRPVHSLLQSFRGS